MGDGAVFLGVGLEREDDVGHGGGRVLEGREDDEVVGGGEGAFQASVSGKSRSGSTPKRSSDLELAGLERRADLLGRLAAPRRSRLRRRPGPGVGEAAGLAQAAGVGRARGLRAGPSRPCRRGRARRRGRAGRPSAPRPRGRSARPRRSTTLSAPRRTSAIGVASFSAPRRARSTQLGEEAGGAARARSGRPPRRRRRARSGGRSRRPAGRRCGGSPCGSAGRGSASCAAGRCRRRGSRRRRRCRATRAESSGCGEARASASRPGPREGRESTCGEPSASRMMRWTR